MDDAAKWVTKKETLIKKKKEEAQSRISIWNHGNGFTTAQKATGIKVEIKTKENVPTLLKLKLQIELQNHIK